MNYQQHIPLAPYSSMRLGGQTRYFAELTDSEEIASVYKTAQELSVPVTVLGSGTNTFFADGVINRLFVRNCIAGREIISDRNDEVLISVGAGEDWDELVAWTVDQGLSGLEALSGIPGTVGAAPVQNIGAYGGELSESLDHVLVWNKEKQKRMMLSARECKFTYRNSLFKREVGEWIVLSVGLKLLRQPATVPDYKSLNWYLESHNIQDPDLAEIRNAVLAVRRRRLPDLETDPNLGSYFVNPVVSKIKADELAELFPEIVQFDLPDGRVKIPAGWLIEQAGLKGEKFGHFRTSADNALVLIHDGKGTTAELLKVEKSIKKKVESMFGIRLEREPNLIS